MGEVSVAPGPTKLAEFAAAAAAAAADADDADEKHVTEVETRGEEWPGR